MDEQNPVYLRLRYNESLESKKNILSSEISLLNIIKIARRYHSFRIEELRIKDDLYKSIKKLGLLIRKSKSTLPFLKPPQKKEEEKPVLKKEKIKVKQNVDEKLESQLKDIQEKLKSMGR